MSERIRAALQREDPADLIAGVKDAVTDELLAVDPELEVQRTQYFNHTYVPDLVLAWKGGQRELYPVVVAVLSSSHLWFVIATVQSPTKTLATRSSCWFLIAFLRCDAAAVGPMRGGAMLRWTGRECVVTG